MSRNPLLVSFAVLVSVLSAAAQTGIIDTVAGNGGIGFSGDGGPATAAQLASPGDVAVDLVGNLYFTDTRNYRVRKVDTNGIISTVAGREGGGPFRPFTGDGGPATDAYLHNLTGVALDSDGNLYIADDDRVRKVDTNGIISTVAGREGGGTFSGDGGPAIDADLGYRLTIAVDTTRNLYIASAVNRRVRRVNSAGIITTVAGNGGAGFSGDGGPATQAQLNPISLALDAAARLYIGDNPLFRYRVRKVDTDGIITTVAGGKTLLDGVPDFTLGDGGPATSAIINPGGLAVDTLGNLYITDALLSLIRKVNSAGIITTVAGTRDFGGLGGFSGDGGPATAASVSVPYGITVDSAGNFYFADTGNQRIRKVTFSRIAQIPASGVVNAAIFRVGSVAPDSWVSVFGENLAAALVSATTVPLPTMLGGTQVTVTDALRVERLARLQFVAPGQLNFLMSPDTAPGPATVTVTTADGQSASVVVQVAPVAPGLFTANASGMGPAAATFLIVEADESRSEGLTFDSTAPLGGRTNIPIDLGPAGRQVYVSFFGTGFRLQSSAAVQIGGVDVPILGAVAQGQFDGLDQAVVGPLPPTLGGRGDVEAIFTFDGIQANAVTVNIQ